MKRHKERSLKFGLLVLLIAVLAGLSFLIVHLSGTPLVPTADVDPNFGQIKVSVSDALGADLNNASVSILSDQTNQTVPLNRDQSGYYAATVRPGTYEINASVAGYKNDSQPLTVSKGQTETLMFNLVKQ